MKTLILIRHAKSDQGDKHIKERFRPLTRKGERRAAEMGAWLKERELLPEIMLTSSAVRACRTAELISESCGYSGEVRLLDALYMAEADDLLALLQILPDELERVMVVGHNPGLESLIPMLTEQVAALSFAGMAYLALPIDHWDELNKDTDAELLELWRPKDVENQVNFEIEPKKKSK